jgi:peptidoglycan/LPS O-acetylase OafA/YrhL
MGLALHTEHNHLRLERLEVGHLALLAAPFGLLLFLDIVRGGSAFFSRSLQSRFLQFMGTISYSFYLWHAVVTFPLKMMAAKLLVGKLGMAPGIAIALFGVSAFGLSVIVSWYSWRWLEQGIGVWLSKRFAPKPPATAVAPI